MYSCCGHCRIWFLWPRMWLRFWLFNRIAFPMCSPASWSTTCENLSVMISNISWRIISKISFVSIFQVFLIQLTLSKFVLHVKIHFPFDGLYGQKWTSFFQFGSLAIRLGLMLIHWYAPTDSMICVESPCYFEEKYTCKSQMYSSSYYPTWHFTSW